ncbi:hypothetical protein VLK31_34925 [Variovorax sp. H27-G14]|uniref:phage adaptor protein n=1 Tax=Variovorax sp. H27-G14 TaxID=3111914 RepID=UPI0038FCC41B
MAADLGTMKARIAREVHRTDLAADIANAINEAIRFYRSRNFEFTEKVGAITTAANTASYTSPGDIGEVLNIRATAGGRSYLADPISFNEYQALSGAGSPAGQPQFYALYAKRLYIYPTPDAAYGLEVAYQQRAAAPSADSDVTVWTDEAEPLIRSRAKRLLCRDLILDPQGSSAAAEAENEALSMLMSESIRLQDTGRLASHW